MRGRPPFRSVRDMNDFILHPTLAGDCHDLGTWRKIRLLLHRDAHVRWFILVPETGQTQWHELPAPARTDLLAGIMVLSGLLTDSLGCHKVNLGAIGNMVPQFHFHVVGRWRHDPYWPGVVWGQSTPGCVYETAQVRELRSEALAALESPDDPGSLPR